MERDKFFMNAFDVLGYFQAIGEEGDFSYIEEYDFENQEFKIKYESNKKSLWFNEYGMKINRK